MHDTQPDTGSHNENENKNENKMIRLAQKAVQEAPESRALRIAQAKRALNNHNFMPNAEVLASRIMADPLHQAHCDM
jgi:hypothetical protein